MEQETIPEEQRKLKPPNAFALKKQFNEIREEAYPWTYDVTKCVVEGAFDDLKKAYDNFFAGRANVPQYKKKGKSHESFYLSNDKFTVGQPLDRHSWLRAVHLRPAQTRRRGEASCCANWERSIWQKSCALSKRGRRQLPAKRAATGASR